MTTTPVPPPFIGKLEFHEWGDHEFWTCLLCGPLDISGPSDPPRESGTRPPRGLQDAYPDSTEAVRHLYDAHNDRSPEVIATIERMGQMGL